MRTGARAWVFAPPCHLPTGCRSSEEGGMALGGAIPGKFPSAEGAGLPARGSPGLRSHSPNGVVTARRKREQGSSHCIEKSLHGLPTVMYLGTSVLGTERSVRVLEHNAHTRAPPPCQGGRVTARSGATELLGRLQSPASAAASSRVTLGHILNFPETGFPYLSNMENKRTPPRGSW